MSSKELHSRLGHSLTYALNRKRNQPGSKIEAESCGEAGRAGVSDATQMTNQSKINKTVLCWRFWCCLTH